MTKPVGCGKISDEDLELINSELDRREKLELKRADLIAELENVNHQLNHEYTYQAIASRHNRGKCVVYNINRSRLLAKQMTKWRALEEARK